MISGKKMLMFRNLWYFDDREPQVPRDIILAPETNGILSAYLLLQLGKVELSCLVLSCCSQPVPNNIILTVHHTNSRHFFARYLQASNPQVLKNQCRLVTGAASEGWARQVEMRIGHLQQGREPLALIVL